MERATITSQTKLGMLEINICVTLGLVQQDDTNPAVGAGGGVGGSSTVLSANG